MEKLEQLGFAVPHDAPEDVQQKVAQILKQV